MHVEKKQNPSHAVVCSGAKELCTFKYEFCGLFYISSFILGVAEMSSFIVSRNTSQPLILRDQDVGDKRAPERSYSSNETLNFLMLLVSYVHHYTWSLVAHVDGVMMHSEELLVQKQAGH